MQPLGWIPESLVHKIFGILQDVDSSFFCNCFPAKFKDSTVGGLDPSSLNLTRWPRQFLESS